MPKSLKWGIVIMVCIVVLFLAGIIFQERIGTWLQNQSFPLPAQESGNPVLEEDADNPFL